MKIKTIFALAVTFLPAIGNADSYEGKVTLIQSPDQSRPCLFFRVDAGNSPWFSLSAGSSYYKDISGIVGAARTYEKSIKVVTTGRENPDCGHAEVDYVRY